MPMTVKEIHEYIMSMDTENISVAELYKGIQSKGEIDSQNIMCMIEIISIVTDEAYKEGYKAGAEEFKNHLLRRNT